MIMDYLIYVGDGTALLDVPARNLSKDEAERYGIKILLSSGLYKAAETPKKAIDKKSMEVNDGNNA
jgi:hypothetical protein